MLGKLRMGVQEAIDAYLKLATDVFRETPVIPRWLGARTVNALIGNARFSGDALTAAIKQIITEQSGTEDGLNSEDKPLLDEHKNCCKVYAHLGPPSCLLSDFSLTHWMGTIQICLRNSYCEY
jgi:hypothetical protein